MSKSKTTKNLFSFTFILSLTFILLFSFSFVIAVVPITVISVGDNTLEIQTPLFSSLRQGEDLYLNFHVYNKTDGYLFNNTWVDCTYHVYRPNNTADTGTSGDTVADGIYAHQADVLGGNFTEIGNYFYYLHCNSSERGGFAQGLFKVTPSGDDDVLGLFIILIGMVYIISFVGFFGRNEWVSILGGMSMMILGVYILQNGIDVYRNFMTTALSSTTIGLGVLFTFIPLMEMLRRNY